ncbi:SDR family NAD(P)-dependent oxidoreductase [Microbacterium sp. A94]|uniref:SDR family NAD(P)-dependent oxidoreductase n=1 Tax=Microbacterium sp. A94 TaxID=3450717 RepID=UPI003F6E40C5
MIVITGAGQGIGAACARLFSSSGAAIVINDVSDERAGEVVDEIVRAGGEAIAAVSDISDAANAAKLIDRAVHSYGHIDGLLNNAGIYTPASLTEMKVSELEKTFQVNVFGASYCAQRAAHYMSDRRTGSIVNVVSGAHLGQADMGAYGASKAALVSLTRTWAMELFKYGVRVNAMSPRAQTAMSVIHTDFVRGLGNQPASAGTPRFTPESCAPVAGYLMSDRSSNLNGQVVRIDGDDLSLMMHPTLLAPEPSSSDEWTYDAVVKAFDETFLNQQAVLGMTAINASRRGRTRPAGE